MKCTPTKRSVPPVGQEASGTQLSFDVREPRRDFELS